MIESLSSPQGLCTLWSAQGQSRVIPKYCTLSTSKGPYKDALHAENYNVKKAVLASYYYL